MGGSNQALVQQRALAITPKVNASLSIPCSMYIIYESCVDHWAGKGTAVQRALMGMSMIDICASFGWFLSTWAVPREDEDSIYSAGNRGTCNFQGFLLQLAIGAPLYNGSLALYYLLIVRYSYTEAMLRKLEIYVHATILTFSIGTSIAGLPLTMYNNVGNVCWVIGEPADCGHSSAETSDIPCNRGDYAYIFGIALFYGPLWLVIVFVIISMSMVYGYVRQTLKRLERYAGDTARREIDEGGKRVSSISASGDEGATTTNNGGSGTSSSLKNNTLKRETRRVAIQAILYSSSFLVTWTPSTVWSIAHWFQVDSFALDYAAAFCEPLQGFWNCMIFIRGRERTRAQIRAVGRMFGCSNCACLDDRAEQQALARRQAKQSRMSRWSQQARGSLSHNDVVDHEILGTTDDLPSSSTVDESHPNQSRHGGCAVAEVEPVLDPIPSSASRSEGMDDLEASTST